MLNAYIISWQRYAGENYVKNCNGFYGDNQQVVFSIDEVGLMQFTGLLDKSLKEIYEGDILKGDNNTIYQAMWIEQLGGFYFGIPGTCRGRDVLGCAASKSGNEPMKLDQMEIIGNVFENPELLSPSPAKN